MTDSLFPFRLRGLLAVWDTWGNESLSHVEVAS